MTIYNSLNNITPQRGRLVKVGTAVKEQITRLQMYRSMQDVLGHTDKDYFNLQQAQKLSKSVSKPSVTFVESLKNFLEKGSMF